MKKIVAITLFLVSFAALSQASLPDVPKGRLFSIDEITRIQAKYNERSLELYLTEDQFYKYNSIVDDNFYYMMQYNKGKERTKDELIEYINKRQVIQNKELKKLLSPEQFNKHLEIYQTVILTPVLNRINLMYTE